MRYYPIIATRNTNRGAMTAGIRTTGHGGHTHTTQLHDGRWIALDMRQNSITTPSRRQNWATTDGATIVTRGEAIQAWEDIINPKTANNTGLLAYVETMKAETISLSIEMGTSDRYGHIHRTGCRDLVDGMPIGQASTQQAAEDLANDATCWDAEPGEYAFSPCAARNLTK